MYERMIQQGGQRYSKTTQDNLDSKEGEARSITKKPKTKKISQAARECGGAGKRLLGTCCSPVFVNTQRKRRVGARDSETRGQLTPVTFALASHLFVALIVIFHPLFTLRPQIIPHLLIRTFLKLSIPRPHMALILRGRQPRLRVQYVRARARLGVRVRALPLPLCTPTLRLRFLSDV